MCRKKKINNIYRAGYFYETLLKLNKDPNTPMFKKLDEKIETFGKKYFPEDRLWRYNLEEGRMRTLDELIERREESKQDDVYIEQAEVDQRIIDQVKAAERKLKRLKMAKYSQELFDEIIEEMMREKKTIMEMMVDLDVDENQIFDAQTRLAKKKQTAHYAAQAK